MGPGPISRAAWNTNQGSKSFKLRPNSSVPAELGGGGYVSQFNQLNSIPYIQLVINSIYEFELLILATFLDFGSRIFWFKILKILLKTVCLKGN